MDQQTIKQLLDNFAELHSQHDLLLLDMKKRKEEALPEEIRLSLQAIDDEYNDKLKTVDDKLDSLDAEIREAVLSLNETVEGSFYSAIMCPGRVSWDTKALDGLMIAVPELETHRKVGKPYVQIRASKTSKS